MMTEKTDTKSRQFPQKPVVFLHLPKTAGSSLRDHIKANLNHGFMHYSKESWKALIRSKDMRSYDFFAGHFNYGFHKLLEKRRVCDMRQITMLRNPIERVISAYYYHGISKSWEDCIKSGKGLCGEYENDMVKRLSGLAPANGYDSRKLNKLIPYGSTSRYHLEHAKINLHKLSAIGIVEYFEESLQCFNAIFGWEGSNPIRVNDSRDMRNYQRPATLDMDPGIIALIYDYNRMDMELYNYAVRLFNQQSKSLGIY